MVFSAFVARLFWRFEFRKEEAMMRRFSMAAIVSSFSSSCLFGCGFRNLDVLHSGLLVLMFINKH